MMLASSMSASVLVISLAALATRDSQKRTSDRPAVPASRRK